MLIVKNAIYVPDSELAPAKSRKEIKQVEKNTKAKVEKTILKKEKDVEIRAKNRLPEKFEN